METTPETAFSPDLSSTESEPFEFGLLPLEIQRTIAMKLDFRSFNSLKRCSKSLFSLCENCVLGGFRPALLVPFIDQGLSPEYNLRCRWNSGSNDSKNIKLKYIDPAAPCTMRFERLFLRCVRTDIWKTVCDQIGERKILVQKLIIIDSFPCHNLGNVLKFIEKHEVKKLQMCVKERVSDDFVKDFFDNPAIKKLSFIRITVPPRDLLPMNGPLSLRASEIHISFIESAQIRKFLEEWIAGTRDILSMSFDNVTDITPDSNSDDFLSQIGEKILFGLNPIEELPHRKQNKRGALYVNRKLVRASKKLLIEVILHRNESVAFRADLSFNSK